MTDLPLLQTNQRKTDVDHLNLLSTLHWVGVGLAVVGLLMLYGHYSMFNSMMSNPKMWQQQPGVVPPPVEVFAPLRWMYAVFALGIAGGGMLNLLSARFLRAKTHRLFSLVVAGFNCFYMPLGTALGVFTIVVLMRSSVRDLYQTGTQLRE